MRVVMLTRLVDCVVCANVITLNDVYRTTSVDNRWKTCFFQCPTCKEKDRTVVEVDVLKGLVVEFRDHRDRVDAIMNVFAFDWEDIDNVEDFLMHTGSFNVPIERENRCGCSACEK